MRSNTRPPPSRSTCSAQSTYTLSVSSKSILVVGASRGIGRALVFDFAARGFSVCGVTRSGDGPQIPGVDWVAGDVTAVHSLIPANAWLEACKGPRLVLVCAASAGPRGAIESVNLHDWKSAIEVNVLGLANVLHVLLPSLGSSDSLFAFLGGGIGGPHPLLDSSAYTASKAAVAALVEAVGRSQTSDDPSIIGISPGSFPTELARRTGVHNEVIDQVDVSVLSEFLVTIVSEDCHRWSGRCLSPNRDNLSALLEINESDLDSLRMRRVDGGSIVSAGLW